METAPESTSQGNPYDGNPGPIPSFGNIGAPYMETLSLPIFTIAFIVWLFSTPMVPNVETSSQLGSPPLEQHQPCVDPKVDPLYSSPIVYSSLSSSSSGENIDFINQEAKKKNKMMTMKKKISRGATKQPLL